MKQAVGRPYVKIEAESIAGNAGLAFERTGEGLYLRHGYWNTHCQKKRGTVLLLGGRTEFLEKYDEVIRELTDSGHDVCAFDWRGQGLSSRLLKDSKKCYVLNYEQYLDDLDLILTRVVYPRAAGPVVLLAHSMGAHIALRYLDQASHRIAAAILTAPMIGIRTDPLPVTLMRWISRRMVQSGCASLGIPAGRRHNPFSKSFARNRLTSDARRFERTLRHVAQNPALSSAEVTFGWLSATFASIDMMDGPDFGLRINIPVLMILSDRDRVVSNQAARRLALRLPGVNITEIDGARHEILQESDSIRKQFWARFDRFVLDLGGLAGNRESGAAAGSRHIIA